jgi:hypothetical protein
MQRRQLDFLDHLAGTLTPVELLEAAAPLSTGEKCYLALASNNLAILPNAYSIAGAIDRLDAGDLEHLIAQHKFDDYIHE